MDHKKPLFISVMMIATLLLGACGKGGSTVAPTKAAASTPGALTELQFDPANLDNDNARTAAGYVFEGLVGVKDGTVVPALAETWTVSDDGLDYIFNLRPAVSFHDGSALNADAVLVNFNRWFDAANPLHGKVAFAAWVSAFKGFKGETTSDGKAKSQYDGIEKVNELTVLVHLNTPDADFLTKIADPAFSIVSPAVLGGAEGDGGTNRYKSAGVSGSTMKLEPFAGYWDPASIPTQGMDVPFK